MPIRRPAASSCSGSQRVPPARTIERQHLVGTYRVRVLTPGPYRLTGLELTAEGSYFAEATTPTGKRWGAVTGNWSLIGNVLRASHFVPDLGVVAFEIDLGRRTRAELELGLTTSVAVGPQGRGMLKLTRVGE